MKKDIASASTRVRALQRIVRFTLCRFRVINIKAGLLCDLDLLDIVLASA